MQHRRLVSCRLVLWWGGLLSGAAAVIHVSLLWENGLYRNISTGTCHIRACRDVHRGGEYLLLLSTLQAMSLCLHDLFTTLLFWILLLAPVPLADLSDLCCTPRRGP